MRAHVLTLSILLLVGLASAQCENDTRTVSVSGTGIVTVVPDIADVTISISSTRKSVVEARDEVADATNALFDALAAIHGINETRDVVTTDLSVSPQYVYNSTTGESNITGYTFTQNVLVTVRELSNDLLAEVIDTAVRAGGNYISISSVSLDVSPPVSEWGLRKARRLAVRDAVEIAELLAEAADVDLGRVVSISDRTTGGQVTPIVASYEKASDGGSSTPTPVNIGTTDLTANVALVYSLV